LSHPKGDDTNNDVKSIGSIQNYRNFYFDLHPNRDERYIDNSDKELIALMMEAASTSETTVNFYQTTWHNNPEDSHHLYTK
jgi:hypothetical protein